MPGRRRPARLTFAPVAGLLVAALAACGGSSPAAPAGNEPEPPITADSAAPSPAASTDDLAVGASLTVQGGEDETRRGTVRSAKWFTKACNGGSDKPQHGRYLVIDVVVEQMKGSGDVNPLEFTFVADDGTSANAEAGSFSGCDDPALDAADLRAGRKRAGKVIFDVAATSGSVEWAPFALETSGSWKVNL